MKNRIIALVVGIVLFSSSIHAQVTFERWYGGTDYDVAHSVSLPSDGGYIITGFTGSFGAGWNDVYLIKTDENGDTLWTRTYGEYGNDKAYSGQQTTDGGYIIVGETWSYAQGLFDVYLVKTDSLGNLIWSKTYGDTTGNIGYSVTQTNDNGYIITGYTGDSYGLELVDVYLIKTDSLGDTMWTKRYGGLYAEMGFSVLQTPDNGFLVAGYAESFGAGDSDVWLIKTDSLGDTLWTRTYGGIMPDCGFCISETSDRGFIISGYTSSYGAGMEDIYLIKTDSLGNSKWIRWYGGSETELGNSVAQTIDNGYIIAGRTESYGIGDSDVYLIKTDSLGDTLWTRTYGGTNWDGGNSVAQISDAGYIIAGGTWSYGAGSNDVYLIKTDSLGVDIQEKEEQRQVTQDVRFNISPNPFTTSTTIILPSIGHGAKSTELFIYDAAGGLVKSIKLETSTYQLGTDLKAGIYFLKLRAGEFSETKKIIKIR